MEEKNYKGLLFTFCLTKYPTPIFRTEPTGPPHDRRFICKVEIDNKVYGEAEGKQKKEAENKAAKTTLDALGYRETGFQSDFIAVLNQLCQKKSWIFNFVDTDRIGPSHNPEFTCSAQVEKKTYSESSRKKNKKLARKEAAYLALKELKKDFPNDIQELPDVFRDESKSENWSYSGSTSDISLDRSIGENGIAQLPTGDTCLDRSTSESGIEQSETASSEHQRDYVATLNEICQKKKWKRSFVDIDLGGPPHKPQFSCQAEIDGERYPGSKPHTTKKLARKEAAFIAWMELKKKFPMDIPEITNGFISGSLTSRSSISSPVNKLSAESGLSDLVTFHSSCPTPSKPDRKSIESGLDRLSLADSKVPSHSSSSGVSSDSNKCEDPLKDFVEVSILASGSFGKVFKAQKKVDDRYYAVKQIPVGHRSKRHVEEVKALANLEHPNIVRYFNAWWAESSVSISDSFENSCSSSDQKQKEAVLCLFIQMELCEKGSLEQWIKTRNYVSKIVDKNQSLQIFKQIIEAVKYMHSQQLIHRDLKPANILFTKSMVVKIGDFGLVTQMTREDESKARQRTQGTGTPSYMAPEQKDGSQYENEVDIYALGLILVELLWIFGSKYEKAIHWGKIREGDLPVEFLKCYPVEECEIKRMLSKEPKKRPSAEQLQNLFEPNKILDTRTH